MTFNNFDYMLTYNLCTTRRSKFSINGPANHSASSILSLSVNSRSIEYTFLTAIGEIITNICYRFITAHYPPQDEVQGPDFSSSVTFMYYLNISIYRSCNVILVLITLQDA